MRSSFPVAPVVGLTALLLAIPPSLDAQGPTVSSPRWPPVTVEVASDFDPLGSRTVDLYGRGTTTAEIHALADSDDGTVRRLYWIQFEGQNEESDWTYDYSGEPWRIEIGGRTFFAGPNHYPRSELTGAPDDSDSGTIVALVREAGLELPDELVRIRLVHLDDARRNELLILYVEDARVAGTSLGRLDDDPDHREAVFRELRERAVDGLDVRPAPR